MRRHEKLIPLSKAHHQMLIIAQVLKLDVPAYKGMPETESEKKTYLEERSRSVLLQNLSYHKKEFYPELRSRAISLEPLINSIEVLENYLIEELANMKSADEDRLNEIGVLIQKIVRKRERELYQKVQEELPEWLNDFAN